MDALQEYTLQEIQRASTELVVYIPLPHKVVAIAWYASV